MEEEMAQRAAQTEKIAIEDMMWAVRTETLTGDTAGYGQVVPLVKNKHPELGVLWHTQSGAVAAPFVPVFIGTDDLPPEFKQHRYLTFDESRRFLDDRQGTKPQSAVPQAIEATRSAFRSVKRLMYYVLEHHETFLPEVREIFEAFEGRLLKEQTAVLATATTLLEANQPDLARNYLTYYSNTELLNGLHLVETLTAHYELRSKLLHGVRETADFRGPTQTWI